MQGFLQILVLVAFLVVGALAVRLRLAPPRKAVDLLVRVVLRALLALMGFRLGNDPALAARLGDIGLLALASSLGGLAGTIVFVGAVELLIERLRRPSGLERTAFGSGAGDGGRTDGAVPFLKRFRDPLALLAYVVAALLGGLLLPPLGLDTGLATAWILNALLFFVGMQFSQAGVSFKQAALRPETIAVPLATAVGSLAAAFALAPVFGLPLGRALALQAGFGWYSLSGVLIADLGDPALGSAAFLANLLRESAALVLIPFLARTRIPHAAIGAGGATAMDVTLPLIEQGLGPASVPVAFASGALLSLSVPVLVPLFFGL
ncbi:MAG TPA: lysine exporter LysO family protein [Spirochaetales bacterium]|nr:lysine exporter LysO family protein [Spirochaetales bacterium]